MTEAFRPAIVVPHYNHVAQFVDSLNVLVELELPLWVVDDASSEDNRQRLRAMLAGIPQAHLLEHEHNQGKGGAVMSGLKAAFAEGFTHVAQIDADGQHPAQALPGLLSAARRAPGTLISARPQFDDSIPAARRWGRKLTNFWVAIETLSRRIPDPMCGFRVYPRSAIEPILKRHQLGPRMQFDIQILVFADWAGVPLKFVDVPVVYPDDGVSHFHYLRDNWGITLMHTALVLKMLPRAPRLISRWFRSPSQA